MSGLGPVTLETDMSDNEPLLTGEKSVSAHPIQTLWQKLEVFLFLITSQEERTTVVTAIRDLLQGNLRGETAFWARISGKNQDREFPYMEGIDPLVHDLLTATQEESTEILSNLPT